MRVAVFVVVVALAGLFGAATPAQASGKTAADSRGECSSTRVLAAATTRGAADAIPIESDADCDEVANDYDNCRTTKNGDQSDVDRDGLGDRCDPNSDNDAFDNAADNCPLVVNDDQDPNACLVDSDGDGVLDPADTCPRAVNPEQTDTDRDSYGDACDADDDDDFLLDGGDNCPLIANPGLADADRDGLGDACDPMTVIAVGVSAPRLRRSSDAAGGMPVRVRCSAACTVNAALTISARDARRLKISRSARTPVVVASGGSALDAAGSTYVFFKLRRSISRRIFAAKPLRANLEVRVTAAVGRATLVKKAVQLRR